ncbi:ADAMTS-like protein 4 isoform X2 [Anolis carolinensis]|uniref:ADAMTS-like protein 4 isoform X2 n=1 Tax=Anolis carolinensis TaxID=28377 RepID=UPI002F2B24FB
MHECKVTRMASRGRIGKFSLAGFSLTLSVLMAGCSQGLEKTPQRAPRQASEDDSTGSSVPGVWSVWGPWSACSQRCGRGVLERSRDCQSPHLRVPWAGRTDSVPPPVYPPHPGSAGPHPARPSFPLHTDRNPNLALTFPSSGSVLPLHNPGPPYNSPNRYSRQEEWPPTRPRGVVAPQHNRRRDPAALRGQVSGHVSSQRASLSSPVGAASRPHVPAPRETLPLFKPPRRDGPNGGPRPDGPHHGSQSDSGRHRWGSSPTPESQAARRSRVREAIKPGKYGYGKVPFALPLHKDPAEEAAGRAKRHQAEHPGPPPPPPPPPPRPTSKKPKRKASHEEVSRSQEKDPPDSGAHEKEKHPPLVRAVEGHDSGHGDSVNIRGPEDTSQPEADLTVSHPVEPGMATATRSEHHHGKAATVSSGDASAAGETHPEARPREGKRPHDKSPKGAKSGAPTSGVSPNSQGRVELRLSHRVLKNQSSASKQTAKTLEPSARSRGPQPPSGLPRTRAHRQNEPRTGGSGNYGSRSTHSLFVDRPVAPPRNTEPDIWLLHHGNPVQFHARGQGPPQAGPEVPQWNLYYPGTETFRCEGESKQYKACSQEPCPPERPDPRSVQCAAYNNQEFMGRFYEWEPFRDVQGSQRCELNCRPIGYRFYVRHTEKVQDGTPCEDDSPEICVTGQCLTPGCDGILGSNRSLDSCGVCGGDHTRCKLVVGNYTDKDVPIGYHRILEIPAGATRIQVKEMGVSPNYLALRSHNGKSIINGNWAVNPPGSYEAAGTVFVYSRPGNDKREGESLAADGPTTEPIDVYMIFQQDNPGVSYQFFLASPPSESPRQEQPRNPQQEFGALTVVSPGHTHESPTSHLRPVLHNSQSHAPPRLPVPSGQSGRSRGVPPPPAGQSGRSPGTLQRNVRVPPLPPPPPPVQHHSENPHDFYWRRTGTTECSATCGKGFWQSVYSCVSRVSQEEVGDDKCHLIPKPIVAEEVCNTEPCPAYWDVGEWSACSRSCGLGTQHRQVLCRQIYANRSTMVHPQRCGQLEKPNATQACQVQVCSHWEIHTNWSSCSVLCGMGHRTRRVRCVGNDGAFLKDSDCPSRHRPKTSEACDMGPCVRTWFYSEWSNTCSAECGTGIQRRSVVCLSSDASGDPEENCAGTKPADMRACNGGPCRKVNLWYVGPWSPCSSDCGTGTQRRDVVCLSKLGADYNVSEASECAHLEKPPSLQPCHGTECEARWYNTAWSACSQSCQGGVQVREAQCLTPNRTLSRLCPPDFKPATKRPCNAQPCLPEIGKNPCLEPICHSRPQEP